MKIETSNRIDLVNIAHCHRVAFPKSLSSLLMISFTMKMLSWYLVDDRGVLFHIEENGKVVGYCGGIKTKRQGLLGSSSSMTQFTFNTLIVALILRPWLLFHSENKKRISFIYKNILVKMGLRKKENFQPSTQPFEPYWGLVVIGVDPAWQGKGIGSQLLKEFETQAKEDKVSYISLSVNKSNHYAIKSYYKNGWTELTNTKETLILSKKL